MNFFKKIFKGNKKKEEILYAFLLLIPALLIISVFRIYPLVRGLLESFQQSFYSPEGFVKEFVGFKNYIELFKSSTFRNSLLVTFKFNLLIIPIQVGLALIMALLLNSKKAGINYVRGIFLIPIAMSDPIASVIWKILLSPNDGLINGFLVSMGLNAQPFFTSSSQALWSIILMASWKGVAFWMIFLVAGIGDIPDRIFEAAEIDGAGPIKKVVHITLPLLKRVLLFVVVANTIANFLLFAPMYIITKGGPEGSTNVLMYLAYKNGFVYNNMGYSMAIMFILLLIVLLVIAVEFKLLETEY